MLPRNDTAKKIFAACAGVVLFFCFFTLPSARAENGLIKFFQEHLSAADGNRCPMVPSCSAYASEAMDTHGLFLGWVMACDRLVRCGRDEARISMPIVVNHREYIYDPVEANDFWWFNREKKQ